MSKKDYKQGMADAMSAYEDFGKKQEAATQHVGEQIRKTADKVDRLGEKIDDIADYTTDQEKAALYKLNTPVDIADLEEPEKRILLAVLYQLSVDEEGVTEEQQNYVRAVQRYLEIHNPQTEIDLMVVENIEDISAQKAVLQAVMEFFRLGENPEEAQEKHSDFLDCFQLNERSRREIVERIEAIINVVGHQGLSEKYGFVPEQPESAVNEDIFTEEDSDFWVELSERCHTCGKYMVLYNGERHCSDPECMDNRIGLFTHFFEEMGLTGYGPSFSEMLIKDADATNLGLLLRRDDDFYKRRGITSSLVEGFADKLKEAISKKQDYEVLGAMGVPGMGPAKAKIFLDKFTDGGKMPINIALIDDDRHYNSLVAALGAEQAPKALEYMESRTFGASWQGIWTFATFAKGNYDDDADIPSVSPNEDDVSWIELPDKCPTCGEHMVLYHGKKCCLNWECADNRKKYDKSDPTCEELSLKKLVRQAKKNAVINEVRKRSRDI